MNYQKFYWPIQDMYVSGHRFHTVNHPGTDYKSSSNKSMCRMILDGRVNRIFSDARGGHIIECKFKWIDGREDIIGYGHLAKRPNLSVGQQLKGGQNLEHYGTSGVTSGPHCHLYMMIDGRYVDPELALENLRLIYENRRPYIEFHEVFNRRTPSQDDVKNFISAGTDWKGEFKRVAKEKQCKI